MEHPGRSFLCAGCRCPVLICSHCDRGQRYCAGECAKQARRLSTQQASQRYQASLPGRRTHAARQKNYRASHKKVTHQGSPSPKPPVLLPANPMVQRPNAVFGPWQCHFCHQPLPGFFRREFLHRRVPYRPSTQRRTQPP